MRQARDTVVKDKYKVAIALRHHFCFIMISVYSKHALSDDLCNIIPDYIKFFKNKSFFLKTSLKPQKATAEPNQGNFLSKLF